MKLEYPLNDALPNIDNSRDRLLAKIFHFRKSMASVSPSSGDAEEEGEEDTATEAKVKDEDYEILYAYILVTGQLAGEIRKVEKEVEDLFGVLDEDLLELR